MSKKFINSKESVVRDHLTGLCHMMPKSFSLAFQDASDPLEIPLVTSGRGAGKVRIICGGGSGHEPAHAGYVCPEMLAAAVCGQVFASPSMA